MATPSDIISRFAFSSFKGFIEIPNTVPGHTDRSILINIQGIAAVYEEEKGCSIALTRTQTDVSTSLSYKQVLELIKDAQ